MKNYLLIKLHTPTSKIMEYIYIQLLKKLEKGKYEIFESSYQNNYLILDIINSDQNDLQNIVELFKKLQITYPSFRYLLEKKEENSKYPLRIHTNKKGRVIVTKRATKRLGIYQYQLTPEIL